MAVIPEILLFSFVTGTCQSSCNVTAWGTYAVYLSTWNSSGVVYNAYQCREKRLLQKGHLTIPKP